MGKGGWSPLVVTRSSEEVIEDLENDGDAMPLVTGATLTERGQSARESPREDTRRVVHKTFDDRSWLLAQFGSG